MRTQTVSTYHEYLIEGVRSLHYAFILKNKTQGLEKAKIDNSEHQIGIDSQSRYAFLMFANALEAAANALLLDHYLPDDSYKELEKLHTLAKIYLHCDLNNTTADKGNHLNMFVKEIIHCRNEFVHPKPKDVKVDLSGENPVLKIQRTKAKNYPLYFSEIKFEHAIEALKDILSFLSWILFDTCKYSLEDGSYAVGYNTYRNTKDIEMLGTELKIEFDLRTFGK